MSFRTRRGPVAGLLALAICQAAHAQPAPGLPPLPAAAPAAAPAPAAGGELEQRLHRLEEDNRQILEQLKALTKQNAELTKRLEAVREDRVDAAGGGGDDRAGFPADETGGPGLSRRAARGVGAQGTDARTFEPETRYRGSEKVPRRKALVEFAEGLEFSSADDEFKLQFHDLTQVELRAFPQQDTGFLHTSFFIPRQRWYFTGRVTKNIEYYTVINRGYGSLDVLDAFLTFRYDERLRLRVGRMKTPYLYEYYQIAEGDLIAPERSLFAGNLSSNREIGAMFLGELFKNRLGYAVGAFNGPRRSFEDTNNAKDVFLFVNSRPFLTPGDDKPGAGPPGRLRPNQAIGGDQADGAASEPGPLEYLNLGGSLNGGYQNNPVEPVSFRTANDQTLSSAAGALSPAFLTWNNNVLEKGQRMLWGAHLAWYYRSLFVLAEYGGGFGGYALDNRAGTSTRVPFEGYTAQASYFLTGERITRRVNVVKPLKDFRIRNGAITGPGAVEVYARYSYLDVGRNVFSAGFVDPNLWANRAETIDLGVNWYLNFYTKIYFDWQHAAFNQPVAVGVGRYSPTTDLFWLRFQLFF